MKRFIASPIPSFLSRLGILLLGFGEILYVGGCLRYTPRLALQQSSEQIKQSDAFFQVEERQQARLVQFLTERAASVQGVSGAAYTLGAGDTIELAFFQAPELNSRVTLRPDGKVELPLLNEVDLVGLTDIQAREKLMSLYGRFLKKPDLTLTISEFIARRVSVIGEVNKPGEVAMKRQYYSLLELLSEAGGRTSRASARVTIIPGSLDAGSSGRSTDVSIGTPSSSAVDVDVDDLIGSGSKDPLALYIFPGDSVVVQEAGSVQVDGEVNSPGTYALTERTSILGAIAAAGGFTYASQLESVEVIRDIGNGQKVVRAFDVGDIALKGARDVRLRTGDVIRVPSAGGRFVTRQIVETINRVLRFGFNRTQPV
jgi:polysaccharide biosynthesis/export protein